MLTASILRLVVAAVAAAGLATTAFAQAFPAKPVRLIVPYLAGGGADVAARIVAQRLSEDWGQAVVVENRPGAGSNLGLEFVAKSPPDGYTLIAAGSPMTANPFLFKNDVGYDPIKSFEPITMHYSDVNIVVVHPEFEAKSIADVIAMAKAKPDGLIYASAGNGTATHLSVELFKAMAGIKMVHVPYRGVPPALTDVMGRQVALMFANASAVTTFINSGRLRGLAVTGSKRLPQFPDMPTIAEAAIPGYEATTWSGFLAPAGTPRPIVDKIHRDIVRALHHPATNDALVARGYTIVGNSPAEFAKVLVDELKKWGDLIRATGATVD